MVCEVFKDDEALNEKPVMLSELLLTCAQTSTQSSYVCDLVEQADEKEVQQQLSLVCGVHENDSDDHNQHVECSAPATLGELFAAMECVVCDVTYCAYLLQYSMSLTHLFFYIIHRRFIETDGSMFVDSVN